MYYVWHYNNELVGKFKTKQLAFAALDNAMAYKVTYIKEG